MVADPLDRWGRRGRLVGVIFAGGSSRRYGQDKALALLDGIPLLQRVADRFRPQVNELVVSGTTRQGFDLRVIPDERPDAGPLAALCSVLDWAAREGISLVMTASCDTPFVPRDIGGVLHASLADHDCAVASRGGTMHPTCALWRTACRAGVRTAFDAGVRSLHGAISRVSAIAVDISTASGPGDDPFFNINSQADMAVAQAWLAEGHLSD